MRFIDVERGDMVNLSHVVRTTAAADGGKLLYLSDGTTAKMAKWQVHSWEETFVQIIPALPGTYLLWPDITVGPFSHSMSNVVAWGQLVEWTTLVPITPSGAWDGANPSTSYLGILFPDGRVEIPEVAAFETVERWESYAEERLREDEARKAKESA